MNIQNETAPITAMQSMEKLSLASATFWDQIQKHPSSGNRVRKVEINAGRNFFSEMIDSAEDTTVAGLLWAAWKVSAGTIVGWNYDGAGTLLIRGGK